MGKNIILGKFVGAIAPPSFNLVSSLTTRLFDHNSQSRISGLALRTTSLTIKKCLPKEEREKVGEIILNFEMFEPIAKIESMKELLFLTTMKS